MKQMRFFTYALLLLLVVSATLTYSCHKSSGAAVGPVSVNVINGVYTSTALVPVFSTENLQQYFANAQRVYYPGSTLYSPLSGQDTLLVTQVTDTFSNTKPIWMFGGVLHLEAGGIYSLFLSGDTTKPDTLLIRDNLPSYTDSSSGCRFVNLIPGAQGLGLTIMGNPASQLEFGPLGYRQVSPFKKYLSNSTIINNGGYTFVLRDQAGDSLTQVTWYNTVGRNNTFIITGSLDPNSGIPLIVSQTNNF